MIEPGMTEQRWSRVKEIFADAVSLPPEQWPDLLDQACGGDSELRASVHKLLRGSKDTREFESPLRFVDLSGRSIGRYRIHQKLGQGGMGVVYRAEDTMLNRPVALKFLAPDVTANEEFKARFIEEARAAAAFDHPNICTLYGIEEVEGRTFLVMAYVGRRTLKDEIQVRRLTVNEALILATETATALQEAHRKGVIHRDIKPSNILVCEDGRNVITDFGLAQREDQVRITQLGQWIGSPAYMAPEVLRSEKATAQSDIWSLGVVLYEAISGVLPFPDKQIPALVLAIQNAEARPLSEICPEVPARVSDLVQRMMSKNPADRHADAGELLRDLQRIRESVDKATATTENLRRELVAPTMPAKRRGWTNWGVKATAAVVLVALGSYWFLSPAANEPDRPYELLPLTSSAGMEDGASFSPDGQQVAFSWWTEESQNSNICVKMVTDSKQQCLTTDPNPDLLPSWSPDGKWIAFLRIMKDKADVAGVYVMSALGGQERELTEINVGETVAGFSRAVWAPDSKGLIISDRDPATKQFRLWLLSIETLERRALTTPPAKVQGDRSPSLSGDGRTLAFVREGFIFGDVYVQSLTAALAPAGEAEQVTFDNRFVYGTAWIPGTNDILFAAAPSISRTDLRLWRVSATGSSKPRVQDPGVQGSHAPAVSADGRRLAFTSYKNDQNLWRMDRATTSSEWEPPKKFSDISSTRDEGLGVFSYDGNQVAFVSNRSGGFDIWVANADGSNPRQITDLGTLSGSLAWSPDGKQIAFDRTVSGNWDVFALGVGGGQPRRLTDSPSDDMVINWSRDGSQIYFNSNRTGEYQIWKVPTNGGTPVQVTKEGGYFGMESADGKYLYYAQEVGVGPLRRLTLATGEDVEILPSVWSLCFAVSSKGIFYIAADQSAVYDAVAYFDFRTGRSRNIATLKAPASAGLTISPDERTLLFSQRDEIGSDLTLVNGFR